MPPAERHLVGEVGAPAAPATSQLLAATGGPLAASSPLRAPVGSQRRHIRDSVSGRRPPGAAFGKLVRVLEGDVLDALAAAPLKNKPQLLRVGDKKLR